MHTSSESTHAGQSGESHVAQHTGNALSTSPSQIIVDSEATDNMFTSSELSTNFQHGTSYPHVTVANGLVVPIKGIGTTSIFFQKTGVTVIPGLKANLLSISKCTN
jgi:hypothetical protein